MTSFNAIYQDAVAQKGSQTALATMLDARLQTPATPDELASVGDDRYLSLMSLRIFRAGLKHSLVDAKWPAFEKAFHGFNILGNAHLSDDAIAEHMENTDLIRHLGKIKSIRNNAGFILRTSEEYDGFGRFLGEWPVTDIVGLWDHLKKHGTQLGGASGSYFLRMVNKDTFIFTRDVITALKARNIIDKQPTAKRDLKIVQDKFNEWHDESGWPLSRISLLLAYTVG
ncbi:DNA-3-methyladenine glycosylase I [Litoribrevibacter euphylliae]|uniref:DNA-3-methyladenine glycosylase I n=1 Tax=Litoribrevibacter euphylliae TaxID=1834034 RepID=A0ABV7HNH7_9GAMM